MGNTVAGGTMVAAGVALALLGAFGVGCSGSSESLFAEAELSAMGGVVEIPGRIRVEVPAGALSEPVKIRVEKIDRSRVASEPDRTRYLSDPFELTPHGTTFDEPVRITLRVTDTPERARVYQLDTPDDMIWKLVRSEERAGTDVVVRTRSFSVYAVFEPASPGDCTALDDDGDGVGDFCDICDGVDDSIAGDCTDMCAGVTCTGNTGNPCTAEACNPSNGICEVVSIAGTCGSGDAGRCVEDECVVEVPMAGGASGNTVCAAQGMTCQGTPAFAQPEAACLAFHPGVGVTMGSSGWRQGIYCNDNMGAACSGRVDTCHSCPGCLDTGLDCGTANSTQLEALYAVCVP